MKQSLLLVLVLKVVGQKWNQTQSLFWLKDSVEFDSMAPLQLHWMATCIPEATHFFLKGTGSSWWNFGCPTKVYVVYFSKKIQGPRCSFSEPWTLLGIGAQRLTVPGRDCWWTQSNSQPSRWTGSPGGRFRESGPMEQGSEVKGQDGMMKRVARKPAWLS